jgi:hypothetical protein
MKKWFKYNGLSVVLLVLFVVSIVGQTITGFKEYNQSMQEEGGQQVTIGQYFSTGHFIESTFENWESEFLQMGLFVFLTMFLYQKGSSESKDPDKASEEVDREPNPKKKGAPWAVRKGGWVLAIYKHSLCYAMLLLFLLSFGAHWYGSLKDYNEEQLLKGLPTETAFQYIADSKFWFESFQNWQSEFLSVFAMVILSVFLRQKGSPQSKPVDAPHGETGE